MQGFLLYPAVHAVGTGYPGNASLSSAFLWYHVLSEIISVTPLFVRHAYLAILIPVS